MTRRELVLEALSHRAPQRLPYSLDLSDEVRARMRVYTGDEQFEQHAGSYLAQERNESFVDLGGGKFRDMFGVVWDKGVQEGDFGIVAQYPLLATSLIDFRFPEPDEALIREKCERLCAQRDRFTLYTIGFSLFERAWTLRSMEQLLCDMLERPEWVDQLLDAIVDYNLKVVDLVCQYPIDCVFFGDDWGQQRGLIMGPKLWRRFIRPRLARQYDRVKRHGRFVAQHSCGDCLEVFDDLVELGLDIYNTFQPEVYDIQACKQRYGQKLTFYGGISTQALLPFASPQALKDEMERIISVLSPSGGFILAPTHAMPGDVPPENVLAFLEVARAHGGLDAG